MPNDERRVPPIPTPPDGRGMLAGKTVLVTASAGTGIGFSTVERCTEEGATVVMSDRHEGRLEEYADRLGETGPRPITIPCDVTDQAAVEALFAQTLEAVGHLDVLVNNAGLGGMNNVVDMPDDAWARVLDVTLTGTMRCTREALKHMLPRKSGAIVNNASVLGWRAQAGQSHYAAAKAGVMALTRCSAIEAAEAGVRINAVAPSLAVHENLEKVMPADELAALAGQEAFGRGAQPWEVANIIVFLASDYASYLTGEVIAASSQRA